MKDKLKELYDYFKYTNNVCEKAFVWDVFSNMSDIYSNDLEIQKMFRDISLACRNLKPLMDNMDYSFFENKKIFMKDNEALFKERISDSTTIYYSANQNKKYSENELKGILKSFLYSVSTDLLDFYKEMRYNDAIIIGRKRKIEGYTSFISLNNSDSYICVKKLNNLYDLKVLVHEIGHAYYNYINNIQFMESRELDNLIKSEIPAMWLELLLVMYLGNYKIKYIQNNNYKDFDKFIYYFGKNQVERMKIDSEDKKLEDIYENIYKKDYQLKLKR